MEELAEKHKHILGIAKGEDGYIKELEVERDHLFGQVFNFWDFFWLILNFLERLNSGDKSCFDQIHILGVF